MSYNNKCEQELILLNVRRLAQKRGVELKLFSDVEKYNFIEAGVREPPQICKQIPTCT